MTESPYYFRSFAEIEDRIDDNYNSPKYDMIKTILSKAKYRIIDLGDPQYLKRIVSGKTPKGIQYLDDGVPFLGSTQVLFGKVELTEVPRISRMIHQTTLVSSQIKKGNVLVTIAGTIGRCAVYDLDDECNANQAIAILEINENEIEPDFLVRFLNSQLGQLFFGKLQHISSQPNINLEEIKRIKVILPNKSEQKDILSRILTIEGKAKKLEEDAEGEIEYADRFLLDRLGIQVPQEEMANYFFKSGKDKETLCFAVPSSETSDRMNYLFYHPKYDVLQFMQERYSTEKLGNICAEHIRRGEQPEYDEAGDIKVIKTVNIKTTYIDYENCLKVSQSFFEKYPLAQVKKNDVLVTSTGYVSMGKVAVHNKDESVIVDGHISIIRLKEGYDPCFVAFFLRSHLGQLQFEKWFSGSSGQIEIQPEDLNQFVLPDNSERGVPLAKQREIAATIIAKLNESHDLEERAKRKWNEARETFEQMIYGTA